MLCLNSSEIITIKQWFAYHSSEFNSVKFSFKLHESIIAELRPALAKLGPAPVRRFKAGIPDSIRYYLARFVPNAPKNSLRNSIIPVASA